MPYRRIIPNRAEFLGVLDLMRQGHRLLQLGDGSQRCLLGQGVVRHSLPTLLRYHLVAPVGERPSTPSSARHAACYQLTANGRHLADRLQRAWLQKPWWRRLATQLLG
jgi:hypothetical protein